MTWREVLAFLALAVLLGVIVTWFALEREAAAIRDRFVRQ